MRRIKALIRLFRYQARQAMRINDGYTYTCIKGRVLWHVANENPQSQEEKNV